MAAALLVKEIFPENMAVLHVEQWVGGKLSP